MTLIYGLLSFLLLQRCYSAPAPQTFQVTNTDNGGGIAFQNDTAAALATGGDPAEAPPMTTEDLPHEEVAKHQVLEHASNGQTEVQVAAAQLDSTSKLKPRAMESELWFNGAFGSLDSSNPGQKLYSIWGVDNAAIRELVTAADVSASGKWNSGQSYDDSGLYNFTMGDHSLVAIPYGAATQGDKFNWGDYAEIAKYILRNMPENKDRKRGIIGTILTADVGGTSYVDFFITWSFYSMMNPLATGQTFNETAPSAEEFAAFDALPDTEIGTTDGTVAGANGGGRRLAIRDNLPGGIRIPIPGTGYSWFLRDGTVALSMWVIMELLKGSLSDITTDAHAALGSRLVTTPYTGFFNSFNWSPQSVANAGFRAIARVGVNFAMLRPGKSNIAARTLSVAMGALVDWAFDEDGANWADPSTRGHSMFADLWWVNPDNTGVKIAEMGLGESLHVRDVALAAAQALAHASGGTQRVGVKGPDKEL